MAISGMEMMLKGMGINPEEIKASISSFQKLATEVSQRQAVVEESLAGIKIRLASMDAKLEELLSRGEEVVSKEAMNSHFEKLAEEMEVESV